MGLETFMGPITVAALCRTQEGRKEEDGASNHGSPPTATTPLSAGTCCRAPGLF